LLNFFDDESSTDRLFSGAYLIPGKSAVAGWLAIGKKCRAQCLAAFCGAAFASVKINRHIGFASARDGSG
jgi:hypothetical protein